MSSMNIERAARVLEAYLAADVPAFLWGAPGIGKSDLVKQIADKASLPLIDVRAVLLDPVDLRGLPMVDQASRTATWAAPGFLPQAQRDGERGILLLDELNAAPTSVMAACLQLILNRRLGEYVLPPAWRIVAAGNRQSDRAAAQRMPSALANRFSHIEVEPDVGAWRLWANANNVDPLIVAFLAFRPELLHKMDGSDLRAFPTPRAWSQVAKVAPKAPDDIRMNLVAGLVGEGPAGEFEAFVRLYRSLPPIASIIADPKKAIVPTEPATLFAVSIALGRYATRENFEAVMTYGRRLPKEFAIVLCLDAVKRDPTLLETAAFVAWARDNQDVSL